MLTTTHLLFDTIVERPIVLNTHKGSAIRGAFFHALRGRAGNDGRWAGFCLNQRARECRGCALLPGCAVAYLLATHDPTGRRGHEIPRPVTVKPPVTEKTEYLTGEHFGFGLTIIGEAVNLLPYLILTVQEGMSIEGLGKRERRHDFQRGTFRLRAVYVHHPLREQTEVLWQEGERLIQVPDLPVTHEEVLAYAASLPTNRLTLRLHTPMRLTERKKLVRSFRFRPFFQRLMERLSLLSSTVGEGNFFASKEKRAALLDLADEVAVIDKTRWVELRSYSTRRQRESPTSGLVGEVTLVGNLTELRPWLVWGAQVHVGKDAVKGDGWYEIGDGEEAIFAYLTIKNTIKPYQLVLNTSNEQ